MKKTIIILLALVMVLSLAACGGGSATTNTPSPTETASSAPAPVETNEIEQAEEKALELQLGGKVETDIISFSLDRFEFAKSLYYASYDSLTGPDKDYMLPTEKHINNNPFSADSGYILASYSYSLKYNGKEDFDIPVRLGFQLDYNDGFVFEPSGVAYLFPPHYVSTDTKTLHPLEGAGEGRGYFRVPVEVQEKNDVPLKISVVIPNSDGTTIEAVYMIR